MHSISGQSLYTYLNDFEPFKYPDVKAEDLRLRKLLKN